ncbi:MAG: hypothetical protein RMJ53_04855 [Chitinophagales bacterium]|nr:hypothetical protein [Chitinophagales bacterium]
MRRARAKRSGRDRASGAVGGSSSVPRSSPASAAAAAEDTPMIILLQSFISLTTKQMILYQEKTLSGVFHAY